MFSLQRLIRSFRYAGRGIRQVFKEEQSFRIQVIIGLVVFILALYFRVKIWEAVALILVITMVLVLELINSVFERVIDVLRPRLHPEVETIKDVMAAVVLISSIMAALIGLLILGPYVVEWLSG